MGECFKCGVSDEKERLFDAIVHDGVFKICEKCASEEDIPVIKRPTTFQLKEAEKEPWRYRERLKMFEQRRTSASPFLRKRETTLRDLVEKNLKTTQIKTEPSPRLNLVHNFHWIIMRVRRARKISAAQLAAEIGESEAAIKMAEKGILPADGYKLIGKLENFLRVRLVKDGKANYNPKPEQIKPVPKRLDFDSHTARILTISDLKKMKKGKEDPEFSEEDFSDEDAKNSNKNSDVMKPKEDLSDEDIGDIVFGRK